MPLCWGSEASTSSSPSGTRSEARPQLQMSPALPAPCSAPTPGLELPGFFPGSGILGEVTPGTEHARATERESKQGSIPLLYKGPPPPQALLICTLPSQLLNIDKFQRSRALQENMGPHCSWLASSPPLPAQYDSFCPPALNKPQGYPKPCLYVLLTGKLCGGSVWDP